MLVSTLIGFNVKEEEGGQNKKKLEGAKKWKFLKFNWKSVFLAMRLFVPWQQLPDSSDSWPPTTNTPGILARIEIWRVPWGIALDAKRQWVGGGGIAPG